MKNCLLNDEVLSPVGKGWVLGSGQWLEIDWTSRLPALRSIRIEFIAYNCKKSCENKTFECILNGLKCSDLCHLTKCTSQVEMGENVDLYVEEDEKDDHDLFLDLN